MRAVADLQPAAGASAAVLDPDDDRFMAEYSGVPRSSTALTGAMERLAARRIAQAAQTLDTEIVGRQLAVCRTRVQRLLEDGDLHAYREGRRNRYRSGSSSAANHPLPAWSPNSPPRRAAVLPRRGGPGRPATVAGPGRGVRRGTRNPVARGPLRRAGPGRTQATGPGAQGPRGRGALGRLIRLGRDVVLLPDAPARAMSILAALPQPFTTSQARNALGSSRRVVIPLLEHPDARGWTRRLDPHHRQVCR